MISDMHSEHGYLGLKMNSLTKCSSIRVWECNMLEEMEEVKEDLLKITWNSR